MLTVRLMLSEDPAWPQRESRLRVRVNIVKFAKLDLCSEIKLKECLPTDLWDKNAARYLEEVTTFLDVVCLFVAAWHVECLGNLRDDLLDRANRRNCVN